MYKMFAVEESLGLESDMCRMYWYFIETYEVISLLYGHCLRCVQILSDNLK